MLLFQGKVSIWRVKKAENTAEILPSKFMLNPIHGIHLQIFLAKLND